MFVKNISINKTLTIIILIKGAFPVVRGKYKKIGVSYSQKQATKAK